MNMISKTKILQIITALLFGIVVFPVQGQDAKTILRKMDDLLLTSEDMQGEMKLTLISKNGSKKVREAMLYQKGADKRLTVYTQPESQAGISTLSLPDGEMWLYLPALGNPKKISILAKSQAFNNTDFSFEDMSRTPYSDRFEVALQSSNGSSFFLELKPNYEKSSYSKVIITINNLEFYPEKLEYYDQKGELFKEADYTYKKVGEYWYASKVNMTNLKKEHSTLVELINVKFDQGLDDGMFDVNNLRAKK